MVPSKSFERRAPASPWCPCRGGWSARRGRGSSAGRRASWRARARAFSPPESTQQRLVDVVAGEAEGAGQRLEGADVRRAGTSSCSVSKTVRVAVEHLHRVLGEVAELDAARRVGTRRRRAATAPDDQLEQRRLAGAVDAHHAPALAAPDQQIEAVVDDVVAVALVDALQLDDVVARARRLARTSNSTTCRRFGGCDGLDLVELLDRATAPGRRGWRAP